MDIDTMLDLQEQALDGIIKCPECGNLLEPDADKCLCGWVNPLVEEGLI